MQDSAPVTLNLLASDGIVRVTFFEQLNQTQAVALLTATHVARTVDELAEAIRDLGSTWGVRVVTEIANRAKRPTAHSHHP